MAPLVHYFKVPKTYVVSTKDWLSDQANIMDKIRLRFSDSKLLAFRSSAIDEDGDITTKAGEYDSVLNILSSDQDAIRNAIEKVIASYQLNGLRVDDEIIVQKMVQNSTMSGVIFTHDLNTGAPLRHQLRRYLRFNRYGNFRWRRIC